jgi:hypothetical protein
MIVKLSGRGIDVAFDRDLDLETVSVHSPALVAFRCTRKSLGRFEGEIFGQTNAHGADYTPLFAGVQINLCI